MARSHSAVSDTTDIVIAVDAALDKYAAVLADETIEAVLSGEVGVHTAAGRAVDALAAAQTAADELLMPLGVRAPDPDDEEVG